MFERFRRNDAPAEGTGDGRTAVAERPAARNGTDTADTVADDRTGRMERTERTDSPERPVRRTGMTRGAGTAALTEEHMAAARARQRDEFGGVNWGAAFFGWLVAVGLGALLVGLIAGAGAAVGLTKGFSTADATDNAETISLGGGIALLVVLMIAYYAGGYVAGRMSRFDGARQGAGAWLLGVIITVILGIVAAVLGDDYNVLSRLDLPRIPIGSETLTTGGIIATIAILLGSLVAAVAGGKIGERYHRRIDRFAVGA